MASTPDALRPREPAPARRRYPGPPRYRDIPRWSLWPWAARPEPGTLHGPLPPRPPVAPEAALRATAELLGRLAWTTALLAGVAAVGEVVRYALLVRSRDRALSGVTLGWSDAVVTLFGLLAPAAALATGVVFLRWMLAARAIAAALSGTRPWRSGRAVVAWSLLPPTTLAVPGATLAEIEHAAAGRPPGERPVPSRPVLVWWAAWAGSVVLALVTIVQGLGTSTQALADGVVLHALVDVAAVVTAALTVRVVDHLTGLLAPVLRESGRSWLVGAPR